MYVLSGNRFLCSQLFKKKLFSLNLSLLLCFLTYSYGEIFKASLPLFKILFPIQEFLGTALWSGSQEVVASALVSLCWEALGQPFCFTQRDACGVKLRTALCPLGHASWRPSVGHSSRTRVPNSSLSVLRAFLHYGEKPTYACIKF